MPNTLGQNQPQELQRGDILRASTINAIVQMLMRRIVGGAGVRVRTANGQVTIGVDRPISHRPPSTILAKITGELPTAGEYEFEIHKGPGPDTGEAVELEAMENIAVDTLVVLHRAEGKWYFNYPTVVLAEIVDEILTSGKYNWKLFEGPGPDTGVATELELTTGIVAESRVVLFFNKEDGLYYFSRPTALIVTATITNEIAGGLYDWTLLDGTGPSGGTTKEVGGVTGVADGTKVILFFIDDTWYFSQPAPVTFVLATITSEVGGGVYDWTRFVPPGPLSGAAREMNNSTGIETGTVVVVQLRGGGTDYFFFPVGNCS